MHTLHDACRSCAWYEELKYGIWEWSSHFCAVKQLCTLIHTQHTATHCNTLQHTATHCTTLQHTALVHSNSSFSDVEGSNEVSLGFWGEEVGSMRAFLFISKSLLWIYSVFRLRLFARCRAFLRSCRALLWMRRAGVLDRIMYNYINIYICIYIYI